MHLLFRHGQHWMRMTMRMTMATL